MSIPSHSLPLLDLRDPAATRNGFYLASGHVAGASQRCTHTAVLTTQAGFFPGCVYLVSSWYVRVETGSRMAVFYLTSMVISGKSHSGTMGTAVGT